MVSVLCAFLLWLARDAVSSGRRRARTPRPSVEADRGPGCWAQARSAAPRWLLSRSTLVSAPGVTGGRGATRPRLYARSRGLSPRVPLGPPRAALVSDRPLWAAPRAAVKAEHAARARRCALQQREGGCRSRVRAVSRFSKEKKSGGVCPATAATSVVLRGVCCPTVRARVCVCGSYVSRALNGADLARLGGSEAPRRLGSSWATMSRGRAPKRERARSRPASLPHCPCVMWYPWRRSFAEALARCCRRFRRGAPMRTASGTPSHEVSARASEVYFQGSPN